jgi:hypothetical protein
MSDRAVERKRRENKQQAKNQSALLRGLKNEGSTAILARLLVRQIHGFQRRRHSLNLL